MNILQYLQGSLILLFVLGCNAQLNLRKQDQRNQIDNYGNRVIILKMDDLEYASPSFVNTWVRYVDSIKSYEINSGLGVIIDELNNSPQSFKDLLISWHKSGDFEIWHHGWDHQRQNYPPDSTNAGEFKETPYLYQKDHLEKGLKSVKEELEINMHSFGAPYNQTDAVFAKVISENKEIKVWLYCDDSNYPEMCLLRGKYNMLESSTGVVSFASFMQAYKSNEYPYLVLQGHPGKWDDKSFEEFDQVINFLKTKNHPFMLPYSYYQKIND
ncbi:MAG: hypothetical protein ACJA08_002386 [Cyclobacteriaceae bacterium]|jgi:hypothetical protein